MTPTKRGRHFHVSEAGHLVLAFEDCPCLRRITLTPRPDRAEVVRRLIQRDHDDREGAWPE